MKKSENNSTYHAHPAISKSNLFKMSKCPAIFKYELEHPPEQTDAMRLGSAFHKIVLEPDGFNDEFAVLPILDRRTKKGKEEYLSFLDGAENKTVITQEQYQIICDMKASVMASKYAKFLVTNSEVEQSFYWVDELTGIEVKCRPDSRKIMKDGTGIITDLKSCTSARNDDFLRDCIKFGYDLQTYQYKTGVELETKIPHDFVFIAVEKTPPYAVNVLKADPLMLRRGEELFREYLGIYADCLQTGNWYDYNGFSGQINILGLPNWIAKDYE